MQWRKGIYWTYSDRLETYCLSRHKKKKKSMSTQSWAMAVGMEMRNIRYGKGEK